MVEPSWVGRRVSVRRVLERRPDASLHLGDVVGDLVGLDAQTAVIDTRSGPIEVPLALVAAARLAPPSTADELALEAVAARGVRAAETAELDGWLLRCDPGGLKRANSVLPLRQLRIPLDEALERAGEWYAARGRPVRVHVPAEARRLLDAELAERGWEAHDKTHVLVRRLDVAPDDAAAGATTGVRFAAEPDPGWLAVWRGGSAGADDAALLARHDTAVFASLERGGRTAAVVRGVLDEGWLGLSGLETVPAARRQGYAVTVVRALHAWALERGVLRAYTQVLAGNEASLGLVQRLGYRLHHDCRYRTAPAPSLESPA